MTGKGRVSWGALSTLVVAGTEVPAYGFHGVVRTVAEAAFWRIRADY